MKILITAFEPFGGDSVNASLEAMRRLKAPQGVKLIRLEVPTVFGLAGVAVTYAIAPFSDELLSRIPEKKRKLLAGVMIAVFLADCVWSVFNPNTGNGITEGFY